MNVGVFDVSTRFGTNLPMVINILSCFLEEHKDLKLPCGINPDAIYGIAYFDLEENTISIDLNLYVFMNQFPRHLGIQISKQSMLIHELYHYKQVNDGTMFITPNVGHVGWKGKEYKIPTPSCDTKEKIGEYWKSPWEADANTNMAAFIRKYEHRIF